MDSSHLVDPEFTEFLAAFPSLDLSGETLDAIRQGMHEAFPVPEIAAGDPVTREEFIVPGPAGAPGVKIIMFKPKPADQPLPLLYYVHGGGFIMGVPDRSLVPLPELAMMLRCAVVSVDYRLAPETSHPGPVEDCYAGLKWIFDHAAQHNLDRTRFAVSGESAGGGLAAALVLLARDRGEVPIAFQHLRCPMLDDRTCVLAAPHPYTGQYLWTHDNNAIGWGSLLGVPAGSANVSPYASPARAQELAGLPPTFIAVGALDLFLEESLEYARRLTRAGVPVELHVYPGGVHGFEAMRAARLAQQAERDSNAALRRALTHAPADSGGAGIGADGLI